MIGKVARKRAVVDLAVTVLFSLIGASSVFAGDLSVDGYVKSFAVVYWFPDLGFGWHPIDTTPVGAVSNRLRIKGRWAAGHWLSADVAYDLDSRIQDHSLFATNTIVGSVGRIYRAGDLDRRLYPAEKDPVGSFGLYQNLDRAQLEIRFGRMDFYLGRQAIAWGSARVINPTDILAPFSYTALDTEDRVGVDALRARLATGIMSELDAGLVAGEDFDSRNSAAYLRYKMYFERTDLAAMVVAFREHVMAGVDVSRAVGGAGGWLETALVWPRLLQSRADIRPHSYWRLSLGADYNLGADTYGFAEYHYNQPGASDPHDYPALVTGPAYIDGAVYLLGKHYLAPGITHQISPLITAAGEFLWNLSDGSAYLTASVEYNVAENVYLAGGGYLGIGPGPKGPLQIESEFGAYPDTFYSSFRFYF
jgi:hypothetical protein